MSRDDCVEDSPDVRSRINLHEDLKASEVAYWVKVAKAWTATQSYQDYIKKNALQPAFAAGADFTALMNTQNDQMKQSFGNG